MANSASSTSANSRSEDSTEKLRQRANRRLLGASVLLLIAIIMVPIFLEREPPPLPDNVDVKIPPVEGTKFEPKFPDGKKGAGASVAPTEVPAITEPTGAQAGVPPAATGAVAVAGATSAAKPNDGVVTKETQKAAALAGEKAVEKATPKEPQKAIAKEPPKEIAKDSKKADAKESAKEPTKSADPSRKPGQLIVQLIAVRDAAAAKDTFNKAKSLKFPVYTESLDVANGTVTRVRLGPYDSKQAAENARAKLAQAGFEAKVITLQ
jgi:DedD protein